MVITAVTAIVNSLQRNKNRTDDLQKCIERRLELLNETVMALKNEVVV